MGLSVTNKTFSCPTCKLLLHTNRAIVCFELLAATCVAICSIFRVSRTFSNRNPSSWAHETTPIVCLIDPLQDGYHIESKTGSMYCLRCSTSISKFAAPSREFGLFHAIYCFQQASRRGYYWCPLSFCEETPEDINSPPNNTLLNRPPCDISACTACASNRDTPRGAMGGCASECSVGASKCGAPAI